MGERSGKWVALFSGGKDSAWALNEAFDAGLPVARLLTMVPPTDSWLFHVPGTEWADVLARAIGLPVTQVQLPEESDASSRSATAHGDQEAAQLEKALSDLDQELDGGLAGIVSGAVASEFQHDRLERLAKRHDIDHFAPLWNVDPEVAARQMIQAGFEIRIVTVAAAGLNQSWLGRRYDRQALAELAGLHERYGVHLLGEGGEFETLVLDGPHMSTSVSLRAAAQWEGDRGQLKVTEMWANEDGSDARIELIDRS